MQVGDKGKEGWTVLEKHKAFTVMYNIVDSTHHDRTHWTEEQKEHTKNFVSMVAVKVWPHAIKQEKLAENRTGHLFVIGEFKGFDTLLEAKDHAFNLWRNRAQDEDYEKFNNTLHDILKPQFINTDRF
jgi:hypothetical protein